MPTNEKIMELSGEPPNPHFLARLSYWLLLLVVALAPLPFGSNRPWAWSLLSLCVAVLLILWAIAAFIDTNTIQISWGRYRPLLILFGLFIGWSVFQALAPVPKQFWAPGWARLSETLGVATTGVISTDPEQSLTSVMCLLAYAGIFWLGMQVGRRTHYANLALWSVALAGLAYALYGIIVQLEGSNTILWFTKWSYKNSLTSTFVNRNHFAIYAGLSILCTLALIANEARKATEASIATRSGFIQLLDNLSMQIVILAFTFMILATALLLTQSRAGAMMTVVGIIVFLAMLATTSTFAAKSAIRFGLVILIAGGFFGVISGSLLMSRIIDVAENISERIIVYKTTLHAIGDRSFLGYGLGSFASVYPSYRGSEFSPNDATYDYAHNIYLQLALESGLIGAILLLLTIILVLMVCGWGARQRHRNGFFASLGVAATILVGGHGLLDFSLQIPAIAASYCLILGVAYAQAWSTGSLNR